MTKFDINIAVFVNKEQIDFGFAYLNKYEKFRYIFQKLFKQTVDLYDQSLDHIVY